MDIGAIFNLIIIQPITNVLIACYQAFVFFHIPFALGFSIIALTAIVRVILLPLTSSQIKATKKMQDLAPHLSKLKELHKDDKKKLNEETMRLHKEHGVNPAAGCLTALFQLPIIIGLYQALNQITASTVKIDELNKLIYFDFLKIHNLLDTTFFGIPISLKPQSEIFKMPILILVPVATVLFQLILSKMMMPEVPVKAKKDDIGASIAQQTLYIFPLMIGYFSVTFPLGLSLYWNTFTIFGIIQQYFLTGPGGLTQWINTAKKYGKGK